MNNTRTPDRPEDFGPNLATSPLDVYLKGLRAMTAEEHKDAWATPTYPEPSDRLADAVEDYSYALAEVVDAIRIEPGLGFNAAVLYVAGMARALNRYREGAVTDIDVANVVDELATVAEAADPVEAKPDGILAALDYAAAGDEAVTVNLLGGFHFTGTIEHTPLEYAHTYRLTTAAGGHITFLADDVVAVRVERA